MMNMKEEEIRRKLLSEDGEFKKLYELHQECEQKLKELQAKPYLTDEEILEEKRLKKEKLALKDKMQVFVNKCKTELQENANS
ncbi:MAG: DUF465 domain-containing protein [Candidatus Aminicenantia bacterium]